MVCVKGGRSSAVPVLNLNVRLYSLFSCLIRWMYAASALFVDSICSTDRPFAHTIQSLMILSSGNDGGNSIWVMHWWMDCCCASAHK